MYVYPKPHLFNLYSKVILKDDSSVTKAVLGSNYHGVVDTRGHHQNLALVYKQRLACIHWAYQEEGGGGGDTAVGTFPQTTELQSYITYIFNCTNQGNKFLRCCSQSTDSHLP